MTVTQEVGLRGMRGMIAKKMLESLSNHAQLTYHAEFDASGLIALRQQYKENAQRIGYEDILMSVLAPVLADHPLLNGIINQDKAVLSNDVHVSVALGTEQGLVAPTVFDVNAKTVQQISDERRDLMQRANTNKLTIKEMTDGTFTISNLGFTRVQFFTPIINTPQIAILGIGCMLKKPFETDDGNIIFKPMMHLSLTADHCLVDGAPAGQFLTALCEQLERL